MTESSEPADVAHHQSSLSEKTSEMEKGQSTDNHYSKVSEENGVVPYVGNYYTNSYVHYPTANEAQWQVADINGYPYGYAYRGYEGYDWYTTPYGQDWSAPESSAQAYVPAESYYYVDNYATANGSTDEPAAEELDLEHSLNQLSLDGYNSPYKNQLTGWNAMALQAVSHFDTNKFTDYSQFYNKTKLPMWDASKPESAYRNGGSARYWGLAKDVNKKNVDKPADINLSKTIATSSNQDNLNTSLYNQKEFDLDLNGARYFVIKSYSEDDIHRSIKYGIWCSTEYGNKRLDAAYREREGKGQIYLLFSVNGSGHFCGVAAMTSELDYTATASIWAQNKWKGKFDVRWIYVKDVPNSQLRHIKLENNENKPVTNSRDTQEVPADKGKQVMYIIHQYRHTTSIFDDFQHYEQRLFEDSKARPVG